MSLAPHPGSSPSSFASTSDTRSNETRAVTHPASGAVQGDGAIMPVLLHENGLPNNVVREVCASAWRAEAAHGAAFRLLRGHSMSPSVPPGLRRISSLGTTVTVANWSVTIGRVPGSVASAGGGRLKSVGRRLPVGWRFAKRD
jgi:hypothetical protein